MMSQWEVDTNTWQMPLPPPPRVLVWKSENLSQCPSNVTNGAPSACHLCPVNQSSRSTTEGGRLFIATKLSCHFESTWTFHWKPLNFATFERPCLCPEETIIFTVQLLQQSSHWKLIKRFYSNILTNNIWSKNRWLVCPLKGEAAARSPDTRQSVRELPAWPSLTAAAIGHSSRRVLVGICRQLQMPDSIA